MKLIDDICMAAISPLAAGIVVDAPRGDGHTVIVLPGFFTGPNHTFLLRASISAANYRVLDWGEGMNLGPSNELTEDLNKLLRDNFDKHGKVSLIGWSLGGLLARAMANTNPEMVRNLITLGSPHRADPKESKLAPIFDLISPTKLDEVTEADLDLVRKSPPIPITTIYTINDEVVNWKDCVSDPADNVKNVEVQGSHLTLTHNVTVLRAILERLA